MKTTSRISIVFICLTVLCAVACAGESVNVGIDYGNERQSREVETQWKDGITALEALQSVAEVETHQLVIMYLLHLLMVLEANVEVWHGTMKLMVSVLTNLPMNVSSIKMKIQDGFIPWMYVLLK